MIGPTISWNRHGTLTLAFIRMTRILTTYGKGNAPTTEIDKHYLPLLAYYHSGLAPTVCFTMSPRIPSRHRMSWTHVANQKRCKFQVDLHFSAGICKHVSFTAAIAGIRCPYQPGLCHHHTRGEQSYR